MKKIIMPVLLIAATLSLGSCNDIQELNVDYGARTYVNDYSGLISALNNATLSLSEKLAAIETAINAGTAKNAEMAALIEKAIQNLSTQVKTGDKSIADALAEVKSAITAQTLELSTKLSAIETANKEGLATIAQKNDLIKAAIQSLTASVAAGNKTNADALADIKSAILAQTTELGTKITAIETAVKEGLATEAQEEEWIRQAVVILSQQVAAGNTSTANALAQIVTALGELKTQESLDTTAIIAEMEKVAYDNGLYLADDGTIYMDPTQWEAVESAKKIDPTSTTDAALLYDAIFNALDETNANITTTQEVSATDSHEGHVEIAVTDQEADVLRASSETTYDGKTVVRLIKTPADITYSVQVTILTCDHPTIYQVRVHDAKAVHDGLDYRVEWTGNSGEYGKISGIKFYTYYEGTIESDVKVIAKSWE